jgi:CBS domain-containing protein
MKVKSIMTVEPVSCLPDTNLGEVGRLMVENDCGEIPVVEASGGLKPVGVITDRDIVCRTVARQINPLELRAKDCMTTPVLAISEDSSVDDCCGLMEKHQVRRALVVMERARSVASCPRRTSLATWPDERRRRWCARFRSRAPPSRASEPREEMRDGDQN